MTTCEHNYAVVSTIEIEIKKKKNNIILAYAKYLLNKSKFLPTYLV